MSLENPLRKPFVEELFLFLRRNSIIALFNSGTFTINSHPWKTSFVYHTRLELLWPLGEHHLKLLTNQFMIWPNSAQVIYLMVIRIVIHSQQLSLIAAFFWYDYQGLRYLLLTPLLNNLQALINVNQPLSGVLSFGRLEFFCIALKSTIFIWVTNASRKAWESFWITIFYNRAGILLLHLHWESKAASFPNTCRLDVDHSSVLINDFFANAQTQSDTLWIHTRRSLELTEHGEELLYFFGRNSNPRILHVHHHSLLLLVIGQLYINPAFGLSELERVFDQVYQNLLETRFVSQHEGHLGD